MDLRYLSAASAWEIAVKYALGRLPLPQRPETYIPHIREKRGIEMLTIDEEAALHTARLPKLPRRSVRPDTSRPGDCAWNDPRDAGPSDCTVRGTRVVVSDHDLKYNLAAMSLDPGVMLGPYEILVQIGAGGMGEVYKARDTRLDRIVAVKVSKTEFTERFERETRAIAALNHPHICQLYDVGPNYLVMEYVEGEPVKGPLPVDKALEFAGQIASALDMAHTNKVTHRDLKPANYSGDEIGGCEAAGCRRSRSMDRRPVRAATFSPSASSSMKC